MHLYNVMNAVTIQVPVLSPLQQRMCASDLSFGSLLFMFHVFISANE